MKRDTVTIAVALAALSLAAFTTAEAAEAKKPVKVFILAGQSNMQGHALLRTLDHLGSDPKYGDLCVPKTPSGVCAVSNGCRGPCSPVTG